MARVETVELNFENLADLDDGRINRLVKHHMRNIAMDLASRPMDKGPRKVTLEFSVKPMVNEDGSCSSATVEIECKSKVPVYRSKPFQMGVGRNGFSFNKDFPDSLDQQPLFGKDEEGGDSSNAE